MNDPLSRRDRSGCVHFRRFLTVSPTMLLTMVLLPFAAGAETRRTNVLLICVDDLKPALGCYGDALAKTPNLDRLASRGLTFDLAFCNQAVCAPSRNALLTGLRPQTLGIYDLGTNFRVSVPDAITLPQWFKQHGYRTEGLGKIFHVGHGNHEDPVSWSVPHWNANVISYALDESRAKSGLTREEALFANKSADGLQRGAAYESAPVADDTYPDGKLAEEAVRRLEAASKRPDEPFFLAVGFVKPHLPFCAPKKYWDLHDPAAFQLAQRPTPPDDAPAYAAHHGGELRQYAGIPEQGPIPPDLQRTLIHGYYAATSYMDAQVGSVLDALDRLKLSEHTTVLLWGDHGWHLGDHGIWCKHSNFEQANRIPLIVIAPGTTTAGTRTRSMAESVDVYPTLCELAGLPAPKTVDGTSLVPVLRKASGAGKTAVYHVYPRTAKNKGQVLGCAVRTARYRLVEWKKPGETGGTAEWELYDYESDPLETKNIAALHPEIVAELAALLAAQPAARSPVRAVEAKKAPSQKTTGAKAKAEARQPPRTEAPHIVFVLADDFGWGDVGCYGGSVKTPALDRMAAEGTRFTQFYTASPICSPSRAGLITGQFPSRWRITSYLQTRKGNRACEQADFLDPEAPSLPRTLANAGYATAHIGKWHLGGGRDVADAPPFAAYGYQLGCGTWESPEPHPDITASEWIWSPEDKVPRWERTRWMVDQTVKFLDDHPQSPCFVNLWLDDTHTPWVPSAGELDGKRVRGSDSEENFHRVLTEMDRQIGRMLEALRQPGRGRETLVIFAGDNGPLPTFAQQRSGGLRGCKLSLYEGGIRVPCIAWWPGRVRSGHVNDRTVLSALDFFPTLCAVAGVPRPENYAPDGEELSAALFGGTPIRGKPLYWEYGRNDKSFAYPKDSVHRSPRLAIREGTWKLLLNPDGSDRQLYNLADDTAESRNVAADHPDVVTQLAASALAWWKTIPQGPPDSKDQK